MKTKKARAFSKGARCAVALGWLALVLVALPQANANNIMVTNVCLTNTDLGAGTTDVKFDLSWDNSWRASWTETNTGGGNPAVTVTNWDAAWVFVKFRLSGGDWNHAWLAPTGHAVAAGTSYAVGTNGGATNVGVFIYRSDEGQGMLSLSNVCLRWNCGTNGVFKTNQLDISVHAIEMVYIPEGSFYVGSGGTEEGSFTDGSWTSGTTIPVRVTNEAALPTGPTAGYLFAKNISGHPGIDTGTLPAAFPKGFAAFYGMKYEITQGQYTEFLNQLPPAYAGRRYSASNTGSRYTIGVDAAGRYTNGAPDRACNFLSWADLMAYADWAGLRPMTELEFEKACRGPRAPATNEYVWGNITTTNLADFAGTDGSGAETANPATANALYSGGVTGPVRAGIFATASSTRTAAGAGYFGMMELGGNVYDRFVMARYVGTAFTARPGDGVLDGNGNANDPAWPVPGGAVARGGSWTHPADRMYLSDRYYGPLQHRGGAPDETVNLSNYGGGRVGRQAP